MLVFDIGANIGKWSIANIDNVNQIIAVEASPKTFGQLKEKCNSKQNILPLNYAVCNNNGKDIVFYESNSDCISTLNIDWLNNPISRFYKHSNFTEIICKTITLDMLIEQYGKPQFIKVDVEGAEFDCISSLTQKIDLLCFEWASELKEISFKCIDYLSTLGFNKFYIQNGDSYTFRPSEEQFYDINLLKENLSKTRLKIDWGMIWCK